MMTYLWEIINDCLKDFVYLILKLMKILYVKINVYSRSCFFLICILTNLYFLLVVIYTINIYCNNSFHTFNGNYKNKA